MAPEEAKDEIASQGADGQNTTEAVETMVEVC